jgi:hypothetical protein
MARFYRSGRETLLSVVMAGSAALGSPAATVAGRPPTYYRDIVPILQNNCQECHRPGQVAPFALLDYAQARKRAADIASVTESRVMPPWHASSTEGGPFRGARVLSAEDQKTLSDWAEAGAPEGDPKDAPPPRTWSSHWALGPPDLVLQVSEPYSVAASGADEYRVFVLPSGLRTGRWIGAVDFKPGNLRVVHHILAAYDITGNARKIDAGDPAPGYKTTGGGYGRLPGGLPFFPPGQLWGWAPGRTPYRAPPGTARALPAEADVLLQVHYHKSGKPETDATSIGIYFAKGPIDKQIRGAMVVPPRPGFLARPNLRIPAGDPSYEVKGDLAIRYDAHLIAVFPHMHWLGKDFLLRAVRPDGSQQTLIRIDDWDFNWQNPYEFVTQVPLPRGTRIEMLAHFDNSASNPKNPSSPPVEVRWGEETKDEMCIGFMSLTRDDEHLENRPPTSPSAGEPFREAMKGAVRDALTKRLASPTPKEEPR